MKKQTLLNSIFDVFPSLLLLFWWESFREMSPSQVRIDWESENWVKTKNTIKPFLFQFERKINNFIFYEMLFNSRYSLLGIWIFSLKVLKNFYKKIFLDNIFKFLLWGFSLTFRTVVMQFIWKLMFTLLWKTVLSYKMQFFCKTIKNDCNIFSISCILNLIKYGDLRTLKNSFTNKKPNCFSNTLLTLKSYWYC